MTHDFEDDDLAFVRDIFVFICWTALAFVDVKNLTIDDIVDINGNKWIVSHRHKTYGWSVTYGLATRKASAIASSLSSARPWSLRLSKNFEDSVRRRYELSQRAARNDSAAKMLIKESEEIRKRLK